MIELFLHMEWADAEVWRAALASPADEVIDSKLKHIHLTQRAFLTVWRGQPMDDRKIPFPDRKAIAAFGRDQHRELSSFLQSLSRDPNEPLNLPWAHYFAERFGKVHDTTLGETLMQLPQHSTYHRGQVNLRIRQVGGEPPLVDFIAWLWRGKPAASWPD
jgi:uncharacterized damage-inducible protein DinB